MKTRQFLVALAAVLLSVTTLFATTSVAQAATLKKYSLVGPDAVLYCYNLEPYPGEVADTPQAGFATFKVNKGTLSVHLEIKHAKPNTDYVVRLLQGE
ncbi:MAG TPA: hypothetical protein VMT27_02380, partial [Actinomycetes bacterium]|nr:hypothetical protein [Actinomycetes bacterium]